LLYRQGHVKEASTKYVFTPSKEMLFDQPISAANSVALRTASERGKLLIALPQVAELPWLQKSVIPAEARIIHDPHQSQIPAGSSEVVSDTRELKRNWAQGIFTVNTSRTQAAMGWIGTNPIALSDVEIAVTTRNAVVAIQSLDGNAIKQSKSIMISIGGRSVPETAHSLPYYSEPVEGRIMISAPAGLHLGAWDARKSRLRPVSAPYKSGRYQLKFDRTLKTSWLLLTSHPGATVSPPNSSTLRNQDKKNH
jgi:hypothetical protein